MFFRALKGFVILMRASFMAAGIAGGTLLAGIGASAAAASVLFNRVIPRQDKLRVDMSEMADMDTWEEYKKIIHANKDWLLQQDIEHITIKSRDGLTLHGDYIRSLEPVGKLLIAFHGYTGKGMSDCASIAAYFLKRGYDAVVVDERAHGMSSGDYAGFGILDRFDCLEWIKYANERFDMKKDIVLYGVSMGGATVLMASGLDEIPSSVKGVIADCAFTSPYDVFAHILKRDYKLPPFPIMNITDELCRRRAGYGFSDYSTLTAMKKTKIPTLFIHGREDNFVPLWMSKKNYEVCGAPKDLLIVDNAGHGASYYENPKLYENKVTQFLEKNAE